MYSMAYGTLRELKAQTLSSFKSAESISLLHSTSQGSLYRSIVRKSACNIGFPYGHQVKSQLCLCQSTSLITVWEKQQKMIHMFRYLLTTWETWKRLLSPGFCLTYTKLLLPSVGVSQRMEDQFSLMMPFE